MSLALQKYKVLINSFLERKITADEFQAKYLSIFKKEEGELTEHEFNELDGLFADVDSFCSDPDLFESGDLDEPMLRTQAKIVFQRLCGNSGDGWGSTRGRSNVP